MLELVMIMMILMIVMMRMVMTMRMRFRLLGAPELVTENAAAGHDRHDLPVVHFHKQKQKYIKVYKSI